MKKIIISCLGGIGDAVILTPLLRGIKQQLPEAKIITVTFPHSVELLRNCPFVDVAIGFQKNLKSQLAVLKECYNADLAFCIDTAHRLPVLYFFAGVKKRIGLPHKRGRWLTDNLLWHDWMDYEFDPIVKADQFYQGTGIDIRRQKGWDAFFYPEATEGQKARIDRVLNERNVSNYVACSLETGIWYKDWPIDHWLELFAWLGMRKKQVVIIGAKSAKLNDITFPDNVVDLRGKTTLLELGYVIKKADLLVNGCSLPVHVANAFNVPVIGLYGSQPAKRGAPPNIFASIESSASCAPCNVTGKSPCDKPFCMTRIEPQLVKDKICTFYGWGMS